MIFIIYYLNLSGWLALCFHGLVSTVKRQTIQPLKRCRTRCERVEFGIHMIISLSLLLLLFYTYWASNLSNCGAPKKEAATFSTFIHFILRYEKMLKFQNNLQRQFSRSISFNLQIYIFYFYFFFSKRNIFFPLFIVQLIILQSGMSFDMLIILYLLLILECFFLLPNECLNNFVSNVSFLIYLFFFFI